MTRYRFFLRGPKELVNVVSGRAVMLLKEKATELDIPWNGVEEKDPGVGEGISLTITTNLECTTEGVWKLIDDIAAEFVPRTAQRNLTVVALDPHKQIYPKE